jgi:hypothetical protein
MNRYKPRHLLVLGALIALPLLMIGVAPFLQVLVQRVDPPVGQVEVLEGGSQIGTEQVEPLEAESLELDARATVIEAELGADDLRFSDADGAEIGRMIDVPLQAEVSIYLEELAVIARLDVTGSLGPQVTKLHYTPAVAAEPIFDSADSD